MTFDTLAVATELKEAGFPQEQAEALARAWSHVASGDLATKSDISGVRTEMVQIKSDLEKQIGSFKSDLEKEIGSVKTDLERQNGRLNLLSWMVGFGLAVSLIILGKLFAVHS